MLLIRSQNKEHIYPFTHGIYIDGKKPCNIIMDLNFSPDGTGDLPLGSYDSKARCLEVLDEIQDMCTRDFNPYVYQMPEK